MTIQTTVCDLLMLAMKHKLEQVYKQGHYEITMFFQEQYMGHQMEVYALVKGQKISIGVITFYSLPEANMLWHDLGGLVEVNDQMRATIMLLYG